MLVRYYGKEIIIHPSDSALRRGILLHDSAEGILVKITKSDWPAYEVGDVCYFPKTITFKFVQNKSFNGII